MQLTPNERRVLSALHDLKRSTPAELAMESDLNPDALMQSAFLLEEKGLAEIHESVTEIHTLTKEGYEYAGSGLPERQTLSYLQSCSEKVTIPDLKDKFPPAMVGISMGWLRRKKWAAIMDGAVVPASDAAPERGADEEVLAILLEEEVLTDDAQKKALKDLIKRKLVDVAERKERTIVITEGGTKLAGAIADQSDIDEIVQLTSDVIRSRRWENIRAYDIHAPVPRASCAKIHPYQRLIDRMRRILLDMGFTEIKGDIVQSSFWNFDAL
ncbi:MAG: phenylalanine--tRNA ligase subunit alpha, partial [Euryarchaeota archaeon]|nr:phenylalanine--tRNA ligase subunit alpha [Euryarchaeota archaeon]